MWSLFKGSEFLQPLKFSNGKNQEDVVKEVVEQIKKGQKIIFIKGVCGTGKSAIALNIAKEIGKCSIVVPGKTLQEQYKRDYEKEKYVLKKNKEKLKLSVVTGRKNHKCKFLEDNKKAIPKLSKEINSKLHDIFEGKREKIDEEIAKDESADNNKLPCKIEIKEKNWKRLKEYLSQNRDIDSSKIKEIKEVKRAAVASVCPYWSPVLNAKYEYKTPSLKRAKTHSYEGLDNTKFVYYERKEGCPFYGQFKYYFESDAIVFNSLKYKLESAMNRKPKTEVEIIDECDEFLDSFSAQRNLNLDRLQNTLINFVSKSQDINEQVEEILQIIYHIKKDKSVQKAIGSEDILPLNSTGVYDILNIFKKSPEFLEEVDEESYLFKVEETAKLFEGFMKESYVTVDKKENNIIFSIVTINLAKKFKEMKDKNKALVLMSGTIHDDNVLKDIFGLEGYSVIDAETKEQGKIKIKKVVGEFDCKYENFRKEKHTRKEYLELLDKCVEKSVRPTLVHINSFIDLPTKEEIVKYDLKNLIERAKLKDLQEQDKRGEAAKKFKAGEFGVFFSTKVARGMDFPGDECKSIVFTKYPNPNVQDAFWKILNRTRPDQYWKFYKDKARRELLQRIYRGLRFKEDEVYVLSPDIRVLNFFENMQN